MLKRVPFLLLFLAFCFFLSNEESQFTISQSRPSSGSKRLLGDEQKNKNASLVLAQERTTRKDPLNKFRKYTGGWNIKERHYWAVIFLIDSSFNSF
ncbi:putative transmembrane protein [Helianthus annuus]|nr:putative transmembrane protein [Helianthus annuus]